MVVGAERSAPAELSHLLLKYGYALLFLGVAVEGETFLLAAALLARRGYFLFPIVIAVAVAGHTLADLVYYFAARARGREWLERKYGDNPRYRHMVAAMERHGRWLLLASRFAFGFRILIPAACGALGMPPATFTLLRRWRAWSGPSPRCSWALTPAG